MPPPSSPGSPGSPDPWFEDAGRAAEDEFKRRNAGRRKPPTNPDTQRPPRAMRPAQNPGARLAKTIFDQVESGVMPAAGTGLPAPWEIASLPVGYASGGIIPAIPRSPSVSERSREDARASRTPPPRVAVATILKTVREAGGGDPDAVMAAASKYLTEITNGIADIVKSIDDEQ